MLIRVYNQNGKVRISKTCGHMEQTMFSGIKDGEMAEIEIGASIFTKSRKIKNTRSDNENAVIHDTEDEKIRKAVAALAFAKDNQCISITEADKAIDVLKNFDPENAAADDVCGKSLEILKQFGQAITVLRFSAENKTITDDAAEYAVNILKYSV